MLNEQLLANDIKAAMVSKASSKGFNLSATNVNGVAIDYLLKFIDVISESVAQEVITHFKDNAIVQTISGAPNGEHEGIIK